MRTQLESSRLLPIALFFVLTFVAVFSIAQNAFALTLPPAFTPQPPTFYASDLNVRVSFQNDNCPNYTIRWGDGKVTNYASPNTCTQTNVTKRVSHEYAKAGNYTVRVTYPSLGKTYIKTFTLPKDRTDTPVVTAFTLTDVKSVTSKVVDPSQLLADDEYTLYTITLVSGKVVEVKNYGFALASANEKAFRDAGYTGDIAALKKMAVSTPTTITFALVDVKSITSKWVDPSQLLADDEYTLYTITLVSGNVVEVKVPAMIPASTHNEFFVKAGYTGNVAELLKKIAPLPVPIKSGAVQGASITDIKAALDQVLAEATALQAAVAAIR